VAEQGIVNFSDFNLKAKVSQSYNSFDTLSLMQMKHLLRAAQSEYAKLEKALIEAEIDGQQRDWQSVFC
jgi:hypothetical protein